SHKLNEVMAISDSVTVLRDGKAVGSGRTRDLTRADLVRMMVGREILELEHRGNSPGAERLAAEGLHAMGDRGSEALRGVDLVVRGGEILGVAGVSGNGQRELAECLAGMRRATGGRVRIGGRDLTDASPNARVDAGMAFIPEERMRDGAIREFSVEENVFLHDHASPAFRRGIFLAFAKMRAHATALVRDYSVKTPSLETPLKNLSGGNIQKLIMARELSRHPASLIAAQPTRGVDIGATEYIHQRLLEQREAGTAILLISEDLDELRALSDRIAVMYEGRVIGLVDRDQASVEQLGFMMAGVPMAEAMGQASSGARKQ
ncbi:MAG: ATP-binding cassette domain-containing protein, partial [Spirochaetota bacterium]